ncbi:hypothetical protein Noda2021_06670 [Candidatus Dependentiae bacterium Noda2021]|nr:hypothetical protein Noda2021_06670 [Candidatus Dependentiae bacterium Noda2021]
MKYRLLIRYVCGFLILSSLHGMDHSQPNKQGITHQRFFSITPTLKHATALSLVKNALRDAVFHTELKTKAFPDDIGNISMVAVLLSCLIQLSGVTEYKDTDLLTEIYSSHLATQLSSEIGLYQSLVSQFNNQNFQDRINDLTQTHQLVTCIEKTLPRVIDNSFLTEITLLLLNDPVIYNHFANQRDQASLITIALLDLLIVNNKLINIRYLLAAYPPARDYYLTLLTNTLIEQQNDFEILINNFNPDYLDSGDTSDVTAKKIADLKDVALADLEILYETIPSVSQSASVPVEVAPILATLLTPRNIKQEFVPLLEVLFKKGYTPNIEVDGQTVAVALFGNQFNTMFGCQTTLPGNLELVTYLVKNGLNITMLKDAEPTNNEQILIARKNFKQLISDQPQFAKDLKQAQEEYEQTNKIK